MNCPTSMLVKNVGLLTLLVLLPISGQEDWQEEKDYCEVLQPEPVLERVVCVRHRRDGHEEGLPGHHGQY